MQHQEFSKRDVEMFLKGCDHMVETAKPLSRGKASAIIDGMTKERETLRLMRHQWLYKSENLSESMIAKAGDAGVSNMLLSRKSLPLFVPTRNQIDDPLYGGQTALRTNVLMILIFASSFLAAVMALHVT